jgi:hypothetical protein
VRRLAVGNRGNNGPKSAFADSLDGIVALVKPRRDRELGVASPLMFAVAEGL